MTVADDQIDRHIRALDSALSAQEASLFGIEKQPSEVPELKIPEGLDVDP